MILQEMSLCKSIEETEVSVRVSRRRVCLQSPAVFRTQELLSNNSTDKHFKNWWTDVFLMMSHLLYLFTLNCTVIMVSLDSWRKWLPSKVVNYVLANVMTSLICGRHTLLFVNAGLRTVRRPVSSYSSNAATFCQERTLLSWKDHLQIF